MEYDSLIERGLVVVTQACPQDTYGHEKVETQPRDGNTAPFRDDCG